jgi:hypothetical protein
VPLNLTARAVVDAWRKERAKVVAEGEPALLVGRVCHEVALQLAALQAAATSIVTCSTCRTGGAVGDVGLQGVQGQRLGRGLAALAEMRRTRCPRWWVKCSTSQARTSAIRRPL